MKKSTVWLAVLVTASVFMFLQIATAQTFSPIWVNDIGGSADSKATNIAIDKNHNVYISGYIRGTIIFNLSEGGSKSLTSVDDADVYIAKYTSAGSCIWAIALGGNGLQQPNNMAVDNNGDVLITGQFQGTVNFNPAGSFNLSSAGEEDIFLAKYSSNGAFVWAKSFGGIGTDRGHSVVTDANNNVFLSASYNSAIDIDPGAGVNTLPATNNLSCFFAKYDTNGNFVWGHPLGELNGSNFTGITIDKANNDLIVVGGFSTSVDFSYSGNATATFNPGGSISNFVARYSNSGAFKWVRLIPGSGSGLLCGVKADQNSNVIVIGSFSGNMNADNQSATNGKLTSNGSRDMVLLQYSSTGAFTWGKAFGNAGGDARANMVDIDLSNNIYIAGDFAGSVNYNPSGSGGNVVSSGGGRAISAAHFTPTGSFVSAFAVGSSCSSNLAYELAVDEGFAYIVGSFCSTVDFDPRSCVYSLTSKDPSSDSFVAKYTEAANAVAPLVTSFSLLQQSAPAVIDAVGKTITIHVFPETDVTALAPVITIDNGAIVPISGLARNFSSPVNYTVTGNCLSNTWKATVIVDPPVQSATCSGQAGTLLGSANGASAPVYLWQRLQNNVWVSAPGNNTLKDYDISVITNATNTPVVELLRRKVTALAQVIYDSYYDVTIQPISAITNNAITKPATDSFCATGDAAVITGNIPSGGNGTFSYKWQRSTDNVSFADIPGSTSKDFDPPASANTVYYRRVATSGTCPASLNSNVITIQVQLAVANNIITAPATVAFCSNGDPAIITGSTPTGGDGTYAYQWQSSADNITFVNVPGAVSKDFDPPVISATIYYRRSVTSGACALPALSNVLSIQVQPALSNNTVTAPSTTLFCATGNPSVITGNTPTGGDGTYAYQWQSSADNISFVNTVGAVSKDFDPPVIATTTYYRRLAISGICTVSLASNSVQIQVLPVISGNTIAAPSIASFCTSGNPDNIVGAVPVGGNGTYAYQWQSSADNITFVNVPGAVSKDFDPPVITSTVYYRRVVTSGPCTTPANSNTIAIQVQQALSNNAITAPLVSTFCASGNPAVITGSTPSGGDGTYTYQWQSSTDNANFVNISGAASIDFDPPVLSITTYYRRTVSSASCSTPINSNTVAVLMQPAIANNNITAPGTSTFCSSGNPALITGSTPTGGSGAYSYQWQSSTDNINFSDISAAVSKDFDPPIIPVSTYYRRTVSSGACNTPVNSNAVAMVVNTVNTPLIASSVVQVCEGSIATISVLAPQSGVSYNWYTSSVKTTLLFTGTTYTSGILSANTTYYIEASNGSCLSPSMAQVLVNTVPPPVQPAVASATVTICSGSSALLKIANAQAGFSYKWYAGPLGGTALFTGTDFTTAFLTADAVFYAEAINSTACSSTARSAVHVVITPLPASPQTVSTVICPGVQAMLSVNNSDPAITIKWYADANGGNSLFIGNTFTTPALNAPATYYAEATNSSNCVSTRTAMQVSFIPQLPAPVALPGDSTVATVSFKWNSIAGAIGYEVSLDNGLTYSAPGSGTTGLTHTITGLKPGEKRTILVRAIGSSACQLSNPATISLSALDPFKNQLFVPNAFTPNGDSNNDVLYVYSNSIKNIMLRIYDQWGEILFRSNDQATGWDGTFKGKNQPAGVYVYVIEAVSNDGTTLNKKGTVTLIR